MLFKRGFGRKDPPVCPAADQDSAGRQHTIRRCWPPGVQVNSVSPEAGKVSVSVGEMVAREETA